MPALMLRSRTLVLILILIFLIPALTLVQQVAPADVMDDALELSQQLTVFHIRIFNCTGGNNISKERTFNTGSNGGKIMSVPFTVLEINNEISKRL